MRLDIERKNLYENRDKKREFPSHPRDPKTVEISPGMVLIKTLEVRQIGQRYEARAKTKDGRVVEYADPIQKQHIKEVQSGDLGRLPSFISHSGHFVVDVNARVEGPLMWRRGRNIEEVKIVTQRQQGKEINQHLICKSGKGRRQEFNFWFMAGVWEVVNPDDSVNPDVRDRLAEMVKAR
jgi:hypothetical protein